MMDGFADILVPVDFSEPSNRALEYAEWFARTCDGTLHLAHVIVNPADPVYDLEDQLNWVMVEAAKTKATGLLEEAAAKLLAPTCSRRLHVAVGDPFAKLMDLARDVMADLIVMATRGRGGVAHLVLGSVAEKTVRWAPCPVFVVRQKAIE
jgi:nucleotide-binding universal stress UspA family protein